MSRNSVFSKFSEKLVSKLPQFVPLHSQSIGHFINDSEILMARSQEARFMRFRIIYFTQEIISNTFWLNVLREHVSINNRTICFFLFRLLRRFSKSYDQKNYELRSISLADITRLNVHQTKSLVKFKDFQENQGLSLLQNFGISANQPIVALVARDSGNDLRIADWVAEQQNYRNTPLENLVPLINLLISKGYFVLRMGRNNSVRVPIFNKMYAEFSEVFHDCGDWSDFFAFDKSSFVLSTASGVDHIGIAMRKRVYTFNYAPIGTMCQSHLFPFSLGSDYVEISTGRKLRIEEIRRLQMLEFSSREFATNTEVQIRPKESFILKEFTEIVLNTEMSFNSKSNHFAKIEMQREILNWANLRNFEVWRNTIY